MSDDELDGQYNFAPILAAAERLLSNVLGSQVRLGEVASLTEKGRRNVVLRCRNLSSGAPSSFIIKQVAVETYDPRDATSWDVMRFLSDWLGEEVLSRILKVPRCSPPFYA